MNNNRSNKSQNTYVWIKTCIEQKYTAINSIIKWKIHLLGKKNRLLGVFFLREGPPSRSIAILPSDISDVSLTGLSVVIICGNRESGWFSNKRSIVPESWVFYNLILSMRSIIFCNKSLSWPPYNHLFYILTICKFILEKFIILLYRIGWFFHKIPLFYNYLIDLLVTGGSLNQPFLTNSLNPFSEKLWTCSINSLSILTWFFL